ncbi:hypothetical protein IMSHALPRED_003159 [Imshaugia aleurites]|uniref:Heterokaryon incompatibility domain-containing protein n=1 Tax=Imshaugia aleurites TaxID=172621 RepID=A0A8H3J7T0_9LECA|nr:hypothetical protein IMSHALPRED_003159 [Imshaugia aleurites]
MRLLDTATLDFAEFSGAIPKYAILSHRWGKIEVSYKQLRQRPVLQDSPGLAKIEEFCRLAAGRSIRWAWIDTCCIDKRNSAELSEAIMSMYKWYEFSAECYVHLADFEISSRELSLKNQSAESFWHIPEGWPSIRDSFSKSSWFTRGWTLQELIASSKVVFYDSHWNEIAPLKQVYRDVAEVTRIGENWLVEDARHASVATRMSWASCRETELGEDMACCLLGFCNVNMPPMYGEGGEIAFYRLQTEIMKTSDDESLFAWTSDQGGSGLLAAHLSYFANSGGITMETHAGSESRPPYHMTNKRLEIAIPKKDFKLFSEGDGTVRFFLRCSRASNINAQKCDKAFYIELSLLMGQRSAIRTECAELKETGKYLIGQLDTDLAHNERIYIFSPGSEV